MKRHVDHAAHLKLVVVRLTVFRHAFVGASKFAGSIAALIERPRRVGVLERVEHVDRLLIAVGLGEPEGIFGEFGIKQNAAVSL